jgi:hypothetical protein
LHTIQDEHPRIGRACMGWATHVLAPMAHRRTDGAAGAGGPPTRTATLSLVGRSGYSDRGHRRGRRGWNLTPSLLLGGAAARYVRDRTDAQYGETDSMLLVEPAVGVERRLSDSFHLNLAASHRLVSGVDRLGLADGDFIGPAVERGRF